MRRRKRHKERIKTVYKKEMNRKTDLEYESSCTRGIKIIKFKLM